MSERFVLKNIGINHVVSTGGADEFELSLCVRYEKLGGCVSQNRLTTNFDMVRDLYQTHYHVP